MDKQTTLEIDGKVRSVQNTHSSKIPDIMDEFQIIFDTNMPPSFYVTGPFMKIISPFDDEIERKNSAFVNDITMDDLKQY